MPGYQVTGSITALYPGDQGTAFNNETPATGTQSLQFAIAQNPNQSSPMKLALDTTFAGAPGAFTTDVQFADTDNPLAYVTIPPTVSASNGNVYHAEYDNVVALFCLVKITVANANAVPQTTKITR